MKVTHLKIRNILGIDELEFDAGKWVMITGKNGTGKTSILEALKAVIKGGHDATLLRDGADKGEIVLDLDDGSQLTKTVRANTSVLDLKRDGRSLPRAKEWLDTLVDRFSNNPLSFLSAKKEDRVGLFLQSMPIKLDFDHLSEISGVRMPKNIADMHLYQVFEFVHDTVYDDRTRTNGAVDEKKKTIKQLEQARPEAPEGVVGGEEEIEANLQQLDAQKDADLTSVHEKLTAYTKQVNEQVAKVAAQHDAEIQSHSDDYDKQIDAVQKQLDDLRSMKLNRIAEMRATRVEALKEFEAKVQSVNTKADAKRAEIKEIHAKARIPLDAALATLRADRNAAAKREQTLETIRELQQALEHLETDAANQNKRLEAIKSYKSEVLSNLPIPGLEVKEGEIYRNGVAFDRLNKAQRIDIAVEIAKIRAGALGLVCVDEIEALDAESLELFRQRTAGLPMQFFVSHVSNQPFQIASDQPNF
jgi:DNA repair exonuclease SbcCD ATPase subunit